MLQRALPLTVLQYRRDRLLVQQVRQALAAHPEKTHKAEGVAALLNISACTLHRQLNEEGASLQGLKDEVRRERAQELLNCSDKPVKQVAAAVGFRNEKRFIRAVRGWTRVSPRQVRRGGCRLEGAAMMGYLAVQPIDMFDLRVRNAAMERVLATDSFPATQFSSSQQP